MIPVDWKSLFEPALASTGSPGHGTALRNSRRVRIEWSYCDPAGIVFYPRYFEIFDASTAALIERALGLTMFQSLKTFDFAGYPLARTRARFIRPTRYGDARSRYPVIAVVIVPGPVTGRPDVSGAGANRLPFSSRCGYGPPVRNSSRMYLSYWGVGSKYPGTRRCALHASSLSSTPIPGVSGTWM